jgi:hypothetical protein
MLKKLALGIAAVTLFVSTAGADYYVIQEQSTKKCKVVESRPTETTWVQVGPLSFKTQDEAQSQVAVLCKERM